MGLWGKGYKRSISGDERVEDAHVDTGKMEIIREYIEHVIYEITGYESAKCTTYSFTSSKTMVWTICGNKLPEFRFGSLVVSKERDIFDRLCNEMNKMIKDRFTSNVMRQLFSGVIKRLDKVVLTCLGNTEKIFEVMEMFEK